MVDEGKFLYTNAEISACSESLRGPVNAPDNWFLLTKFLGQDPGILHFQQKYSHDTDSAEAHVLRTTVRKELWIINTERMK